MNPVRQGQEIIRFFIAATRKYPAVWFEYGDKARGALALRVGQLKCEVHHPPVGCNGPSDFARTSASAAQKQTPNTQTQLER